MSFNPDAFDQGAFDPAAFDFTEGGGGGGAGHASGGTVVDADGIMHTTFLADGVPVPGTAVFINGIAHTPLGERYVALWPASGIVSYSAGRAIRPDGAQIIIESAPTRYMGGIGYIQRGDMCVTAVASSNFVQGFSVNENGQVAVSDLN